MVLFIGFFVAQAQNEGPNPTERTVFNPELQERCKGESRSDICEGDSSCEKICEDIFTKGSNEEKCKELSVDMVREFRKIFEMMEDDDELDNIKAKPLRCLLDISETEFAKEAGQLRKPETKKFLEIIAADDALADALRAEDDEFKILEKLLDNFNLDDRLEAFEQTIEGSNTLIELIVDNTNEAAWKWVVEGYMVEQCGEDSSNYCSGEANARQNEDKELVFFCKVYAASNANSSTISNLLDFEPFEGAYEDTITGVKNCGCNDDGGTSPIEGGNPDCNNGPDNLRKCQDKASDFLQDATFVGNNFATTGNLDNNHTVCSYLAGTAGIKGVE